MRREPVVAGQFYSGTEAALRKEVEGFIHHGYKPESVLGIVLWPSGVDR